MVGIYSNTVMGDGPSTPRAGSDGQSAEWIDCWKNKMLAFNHAEILAYAERGPGLFRVAGLYIEGAAFSSELSFRRSATGRSCGGTSPGSSAGAAGGGP
jgi:hypothetical protein